MRILLLAQGWLKLMLLWFSSFLRTWSVNEHVLLGFKHGLPIPHIVIRSESDPETGVQV